MLEICIIEDALKDKVNTSREEFKSNLAFTSSEVILSYLHFFADYSRHFIWSKWFMNAIVMKSFFLLNLRSIAKTNWHYCNLVALCIYNNFHVWGWPWISIPEFTTEAMCTQAYFTHTRCMGGVNKLNSLYQAKLSNMANRHYHPWK